jgi:ABC-type multidrug transport system fused ATPase/permease subunit
MATSESAILEKVKAQQDDALFKKKTHFNAADRNRKYYRCFGLLVVVASLLLLLLNGLAKFAEIFGGADWLPWWVNAFWMLIIIGLGFLQQHFHMPLVIAHQRVAVNFLVLYKAYGRILAAYKDGVIVSKVLYDKFEMLSEKFADVIKEGCLSPTSDRDEKEARRSIVGGDEAPSRSDSECALLGKVDDQNEDALIEKNKHLNAAKRKLGYDSRLKNLSFVINFVVFVMLLVMARLTQMDWLNWFAVLLVLISSILVLMRTYLNFLPTIEAHKQVAERFGLLCQDYGKLKAAYRDSSIDLAELYAKLEKVSDDHHRIIRDGSAFPTNYGDYRENSQKWFRFEVCGL